MPDWHYDRLRARAYDAALRSLDLVLTHQRPLQSTLTRLPAYPPGVPFTLRVLVRFRKGRALADKSNVEGALAALSRATQLDPSNQVLLLASLSSNPCPRPSPASAPASTAPPLSMLYAAAGEAGARKARVAPQGKQAARAVHVPSHVQRIAAVRRAAQREAREVGREPQVWLYVRRRTYSTVTIRVTVVVLFELERQYEQKPTRYSYGDALSVSGCSGGAKCCSEDSRCWLPSLPCRSIAHSVMCSRRVPTRLYGVSRLRYRAARSDE